MPMIESVIIIGTKCLVPSGRIGRLKRRNPYVPIFSRTPARMTDPAVGASTCASGSHVWNGNIGTLIANPTKNARKIQYWKLEDASDGRYGAMAWKARTSNVGAVP